MPLCKFCREMVSILFTLMFSLSMQIYSIVLLNFEFLRYRRDHLFYSSCWWQVDVLTSKTNFIRQSSILKQTRKNQQMREDYKRGENHNFFCLVILPIFIFTFKRWNKFFKWKQLFSHYFGSKICFIRNGTTLVVGCMRGLPTLSSKYMNSLDLHP